VNRRLNARRFDSDDVGDLVDVASRLDDLTDHRVSYSQLIEIADELGVPESSIRAALVERDRERRANTKLARKQVRRRMRLIRHMAVYAIVISALFVVDALGGGGWWFGIVAALWGIALALHALRFMTRRSGPLEAYLLRKGLD
jgi:hypothetical protein